MSESRLQDKFIDGSYATNPKAEILPGQHKMFNDAFNFVDGVKYPLSLAHHSIPQDGDQIVMVGCGVVPGDSFSPDSSPEEFHRHRYNGSLNYIFKDNRKLFVPDKRGRSYMTSLNFRDENEFRETVSKLSADFGHRALHVLDAGCGQGLAFRDLLTLDEIDVEKSVGFSLPTRDRRRKLNLRLLYADVMHCGMKRRFDMVFSVHGAFRYHPTNLYSQKNIAMLSILQSIDLTQEGGLLLNDVINFAMPKLFEMGILEYSESSVSRVLRHPTVDEVMELMVR